MKKSTKIVKRLLALFLVVLMSIESFGALVSDNDGSAFITKGEFDSLKSSFQSQIDNYNTSIDSKIDGAIASYLAGVKLDKEIRIRSIWDKMNPTIVDPDLKMFCVVGRENNNWFYFPGQGWLGDYGIVPVFTYDIDLKIANYMPAHRNDAVATAHARIFTRNTNLVNASLEGDSSSGSINTLYYGLRCTSFHHGFKELTTRPAQWDHACFVSSGPSIAPGFELIFKPLTFTYEAGFWSAQGSGNTFNGNEWRARFMLRDAAPNSTYPAAPTLDEPLYHFDRTSLGSTTSDWSYVANNGSNGTEYRVENGEFIIGKTTPSWGADICYFWPNATDQSLFVFNATNISQNFKTTPVPDGAKWGNWDAINLDVNNQRNSVVQSPIAERLAEDLGYTIFKWEDLPLSGVVTSWSSDQLKNITALNWAKLKDQDKLMSLGDAPRIVTSIEQSGSLTITGGCAIKFFVGTYDPIDGCRIYFSPNGRNDVVNSGTDTNPTWNINNKMKFRYRLLGENQWSSETTELLVPKSDMESKYYEFKFDEVEAKRDIYMHLLAGNNADYQKQWFRVDAKKDIEVKLTTES